VVTVVTVVTVEIAAHRAVIVRRAASTAVIGARVQRRRVVGVKARVAVRCVPTKHGVPLAIGQCASVPKGRRSGRSVASACSMRNVRRVLRNRTPTPRRNA